MIKNGRFPASKTSRGTFCAMSDFAIAWTLSRGRFVEALEGLSQEQLNWRMHPGTLTLSEMALHVAGVEVSFIAQLTGCDLDADLQHLRLAATEGVVNEMPFPYPAEQMTPERVLDLMAKARELVQPVIESPNQEIRGRQIKSALGPMIDGNGAMARLAFHPGYHQGQAHFIKTAPGFPS
jgi:hypothetical protein